MNIGSLYIDPVSWSVWLLGFIIWIVWIIVPIKEFRAIVKEKREKRQ